MPTETDPDFAPSLWLLPPSRRPHLRAISAFVALTRSAATAPALPTLARVARLRALANAVEDPTTGIDGEPAAIMADVRRTLAETESSPGHLHHLVQAREREAGGWRPETWGDVLVHCRFVAAPVGRLVLEICGEDVQRSGRVIDALSTALWVLYGVRDLDGDGPDYPPPCIPRRFLTDAMINARPSPAGGARGQVRAVLDRVLDGVDRLLLDARPLPRLLSTPGLRSQAATALCRAGKIAVELRHRDPFHVPVRLSRSQRWLCLGFGLLRGMLIRRD